MYKCKWKYHDTGRGYVKFNATKDSPWAREGEPESVLHPDIAKALDTLALSINYKMIQDGESLR